MELYGDPMRVESGEIRPILKRPAQQLVQDGPDNIDDVLYAQLTKVNAAKTSFPTRVR